MEIEVKGHSGCKIDIVREGDDLFIYKSSNDKKYLHRLVRQAEKQQQASLEDHSHIRIPQIFDIKQDANHVSVKMEYIYSRNFVEHFEMAGFEQIDYFVKALITFIEKELRTSPLQSVPTTITMQKFLDVEDKVYSNPLIKDDKQIHVLMKQSKNVPAKNWTTTIVSITMFAWLET